MTFLIANRQVHMMTTSLLLGRPDALPIAPQRWSALAACSLLTALALVVFSADAAWAGQSASVSRTDRFTAPVAVTSLDVVSENGGIRVTAGAVFAATVSITARGDSEAEATSNLAATKIEFTSEGGRAVFRSQQGSQERSQARSNDNDGRRVETRYEITLPAGATVKARTANGAIRIDGITATIDAETVNGSVGADGAAASISLKSVNGKVESTLAKVPANARIKLETVNGAVSVNLPADAKFKVRASYVNGSLVSNLPLPERELDTPFGPPPPYEGSVGGGGGEIVLSTVNGRLAIMQTGGGEARPLQKRSDKFRAHIALPPRPPHGAHPPPPPGASGWDDPNKDIRIPNVAGDFSAIRAGADVSVENIGGMAKVRTAAGDVRLGNVAKEAEIHTAVGDIRVRSVGGTVQAFTGGGDVRIEKAGGHARVETMGGDIEVRQAAAGITARTRGGDVSLREVHGGVKADTAGGDITLEMAGKDAGSGIQVDTRGGDVNLRLPADFRADVDIETRIDGDDDDGGNRQIVSDFAGLTITRSGRTLRAVGKIGGGGPRLQVRTLSGTVRIKKN